MIVCHGCHKEITGSYIEALGHTWHKSHFVCAVCQREFPDSKFMEHGGKPYCNHDYYDKFGERCPGCDKPITGQYIEALGHKWHKDHFVCTACKKPIGDAGFVQHDGKPYCERDSYEIFGKRCNICRQPVRGEYFSDYWENIFCARHTHDLDQCFTCRRLICEGITGGGMVYEDGRKICNLCRKVAIDTIEAALPLFAQVQSVLAKKGLSLDKSVRMPLRLASEDEIDKLAGGTPQIEAGLTLMETLTIGGLETGRNVKEIVILYGLPCTHAAAVMAHEFGHVWCFLNRLPELPRPELEGICEMFSYEYLSAIDTPESEFHRKGLESNRDPVYGGGFRQIRDLLKGRTLHALLKDVGKRGGLC